MNKGLVKILNIVYIIGAGVSLYALCTRPMISLTANVNFTGEQIGRALNTVLGKNLDSGSSSEHIVESRAETRADGEFGIELSDYVNAEKIATYFPNGLKREFTIKVDVKKAFDLKNERLLDEILEENIYSLVDGVVDELMPPLKRMFRDIFEGFATESLAEQINNYIEEWFPESETASTEEVAQVFENVFDLVDQGEPVTVEELADTILNGNEAGEGGVLSIINSRGGKYIAWDPQPTQEEVEADISAEEGEEKYYLLDTVKYVHNTEEYSESKTYHGPGPDYPTVSPTPEQVNADKDQTDEELQQYFVVYSKTYKHNTEAYDSETTYYKQINYTGEDVDADEITAKMTDALQDVEGLVETKYVLVTDAETGDPITPADLAEDMAKPEEDRVYYVKDGEGNYVLPEEGAEGPFYKKTKYVNDVETALNALIQSLIDSGANKGKTRAVRAEELSAEQEKTLNDTVKELVMNLLGQLNLTERTGVVGQKAPLILFALVALFALPWAYFALFTFIRTMRQDKCWTRPIIILFWCLPQAVFGILVKYGSKAAWKTVSQNVEQLKEFSNSISFDMTTGAVIPAFVYMGMAVLTIVYWIVRHPVKAEYKQKKRINKYY